MKDKTMITNPIKIFGFSESTGSSALIIENDNLSTDDRLKFATNQNYAASVFVDQNNHNSYQGGNLDNPCIIHTNT